MLVVTKNTWVSGKGSCVVCVDLQTVELTFGERFWPIIEGGFRWALETVIFSNRQHFAVSTGIYGVACPLLPSGVNKH